MPFRIGFPVDTGKAASSFIVLTKIHPAQSHSCKGGGVSGLRADSGAAFVFERVSLEIKARYRFQFAMIPPANPETTPENMCDLGCSESVACALAVWQAGQENENCPVVLVSCTFVPQPQEQGLGGLRLEKVSSDNQTKARGALFNKWTAANRNQCLALVLHEYDAEILCQNPEIQRLKLGRDTFTKLARGKRDIVPVVSCRTNQLELLAAAVTDFQVPSSSRKQMVIIALCIAIFLFGIGIVLFWHEIGPSENPQVLSDELRQKGALGKPDRQTGSEKAGEDTGYESQSEMRTTLSKTEEATVEAMSPDGWPEVLWKTCWNSSKRWVDFSQETWENLPHEQQVAYAKAYQAWYARGLHVPVTKDFSLGSTKIVMVLIPPGKFWMGSPDKESARHADEERHRVILSQPFWIGKTEVTQATWEQGMGKNPSHYPNIRDPVPVESITWDDCQTFCQKAGHGFRLPTETEWEYSCRAETTRAYCFGDEISLLLGAYAWYEDNAGRKTHLVGEKYPNAFGLYDMHGNVREWCADWYERYSPGEDVDPTGPPIGSRRVYRSGSWYDGRRDVRSACRAKETPRYRSRTLGVRLARSFSEKSTTHD